MEIRDSYEASMIVDLNSPRGNIFALMGIVTDYLKRNNQRDEIDEFREKAMSGSYENGVLVCQEYCPDLRIVGYVD